MTDATETHAELGRTGLRLPPILFGTSCLGNLYEVVGEATKTAIVSEIFRHSPSPVVLDSAGKYGAGLALEVIGRTLNGLSIPPSQVILSNKLGWYRIPMRGPEPTFEEGVWAGIQHDAESRISHDGILQCYEQGCELLGAPYAPQMVSVHDPDEYLAMARDPGDRRARFGNVLDAYKALFELKREGRVSAVGIGAKDWRVIGEIAGHVDLDWAMFACSLTVYSHPGELLELIATLQTRGVGMINSAVFNAGFLIGGRWFNYRQPDPVKEGPLFAWRERFLGVCKRFDVAPADACIQFGLAVPGIVSIALNTGRPERIQDNIAAVSRAIPDRFWTVLKDENVIARDFPIGS